jgi:hypothetical protein
MPIQKILQLAENAICSRSAAYGKRTMLVARKLAQKSNMLAMGRAAFARQTPAQSSAADTGQALHCKLGHGK